MMRSPAGGALRCHICTKRRRILKNVESESMVRMDDCRDARICSCPSAKSARVGAVCVNDIRPQFVKSRLQMAVCLQISPRANLADEVIAKVNRNVRKGRGFDIEHSPFAGDQMHVEFRTI